MNLEKLSTEKVNINTLDIDEKNMYDILKLINDEDKTVALSVEKEMCAIEKLAIVMMDTLSNGGRIFYVGAGTSGRLGVLDSAECPPTYGTPPDFINALIAGGQEAMLKAVEGAEDSKELSVTELKEHKLISKDLVIGIAASGRTPYVIAAMTYARDIGCKTGAIAATKNSKIGLISNFAVEVEVGPEVVTGSTRMKAGTAQKLILNMLSSAVMIKLGRVYNNEMVSLIATNEKLYVRSRNILMRVTGINQTEAVKVLSRCNGDLKAAIVSCKLNIPFNEASRLLTLHRGVVKKVIQNYE